jgi:hypothetical protein
MWETISEKGFDYWYADVVPLWDMFGNDNSWRREHIEYVREAYNYYVQLKQAGYNEDQIQAAFQRELGKKYRIWRK